MIYHLKPELDPQIKETISRYIDESAEVMEIPTDIIIGLMWKESRFNPMAVSKAGAVGLMQVMWDIHEAKAKELGITKDRRFWIQENIRLGVGILKDYLDETKSTQKALAKYLGENNGDYVIDVLTTATDLRLFVERDDPMIKNNVVVGPTIYSGPEYYKRNVYDKEGNPCVEDCTSEEEEEKEEISTEPGSS
jgi:soluble lytic murein transglycosylase-like protein